MTGKGELYVAWCTIFEFCGENDCETCPVYNTCTNAIGILNLFDIAGIFTAELKDDLKIGVKDDF